jgi:hypothetical protein
VEPRPKKMMMTMMMMMMRHKCKSRTVWMRFSRRMEGERKGY